MPLRNGFPTKAELTAEENEQFTRFLQRRGFQSQDKALANRNRSVAEAAGREALFAQQIDQVLEKIKGKFFPGKDYTPKKKGPVELAASLILSDLHYGASLDRREVPLAYGHVEEARRTAAVALWIANHRDLKTRQSMELHLDMLGDIIQGQLHDPRDGMPQAEQVAAAILLLTQFVTYVSGAGYQKVHCHCTPGNHGRNTARHKERATNQKWDAIETQIYFAVKMATQHLPNVTFDIPYTPWVTYKVFDHWIFATHGDTVLTPGYPGQTINVGNVKKQVNEINTHRLPHERFKAFIVGHVHVSSKVKLPNDTYFMSNGCLIPTDAYAQSIGIVDTPTCQTMFESTPTHVVGYHCDIDVDESTDKDKSLDKIIQPFTSF
jgi:hypothetical protein